PADAPALAAAIVDLLASPARARELADRGQAEVLAHHSLDATMRRTVAVYEAARKAATGG
ncbi:MAG TPA: glycosyltransferase, partial [Methylomirabilota bacterium]|nr:glycosyltransferase [Methylomirabilota bacterium]